MPPKKNEAANVARKPIVGRLGTSLKMGIVGLPNVGKSTFFNILTKLQAAAENFPFCTIDPNEGRVPVPDARFDYCCEVYKPANKCPAFLNITDIAGLVKGANEGQGLGNAFLSHIKACDGIFQMIRIFDDEEIIHVEGEVDPLRDIGIINEELRLKDVEYAEKAHDDAEKKLRQDKTMKGDVETLKMVLHVLKEEKKWVRYHDWNEKDIEVLNKHLFITAKPCVYLLNMSEVEFIKKKSKWLPKIKAWIDENDPGAQCIPFSAPYELKLQEMATDAERKATTTANNAASQMDKIIVTGYKTLQLCYFFTVGEDEVKCWTLQVGSHAPQAAGRIHTDFEKGFIMAEVMKFEDFKENEGSESAVKAAGKYRQQGKQYIVEDGDIILFKFNAGAGLSEKKK